MKKVFFIAFLVASISCQKNNVLEEVSTNDFKKELSVTSFESEYTALCQYFKDQNQANSGALFNYMYNNPSYNFQELINLGYVQESDLNTLLSNVTYYVDNASDEDEILSQANTIQIDLNISGLVFIKCTGCLDGIRRNHCWEFFDGFLSSGPGC